MNKNILALMPVFIFMIGMLIVSIYVRRASAKRASEGFVKDYFSVPEVWAVLYWR